MQMTPNAVKIMRELGIGEQLQQESWNVPSNTQEMAVAFEGLHPNVLKLFSEATTVFKRGLFDRDPMQRWSLGRITLLGDAARPAGGSVAQVAALPPC
jgi:salicylate hydroxylase